VSADELGTVSKVIRNITQRKDIYMSKIWGTIQLMIHNKNFLLGLLANTKFSNLSQFIKCSGAKEYAKIWGTIKLMIHNKNFLLGVFANTK
jgi:hypothetical protein